ncbi:MAG: hydrolase 1, exosortase A system-associated [Rhodocyclales bacterium GT-UBC]|nr:MAG: hydrolase 1, exosortase A system-associated [Rhodocyclales bacterium GT-UBC]
MTLYSEQPLVFDCLGERLPGILSIPEERCGTGVVIVVGGPQYRVGSHRQFVLLARSLAAAGFPVLRFDTRGMGDATGNFPGFEHLGPDIASAVQAFRQALPDLQKVVLWGLCDAASAILISQPLLTGISGLVLLNPWVRNAETLANAEIKHYYHKRLLDRAFWVKLLSGQVNVLASLGEFAGKLWRRWRGGSRPVASVDFRARMVDGWQAFQGPSLLILSGVDMVAAEFVEFAASHPQLAALLQRPDIVRLDLDAADHTFSSALLRSQVEMATGDWLSNLSRGEPR